MNGNWIRETSTTTGTGDLTLSAVSGFTRFLDVFSANDLISYVIFEGTEADPTSREAGIGTIKAGNILERTTISSTYSSGVYDESSPAAINFSENVTVYSAIHFAANELTDSLQIRNATDALNTGVYSFQTDSGIAATGVAYIKDTVNTLSGAGIHTSWRHNGAELASLDANGDLDVTGVFQIDSITCLNINNDSTTQTVLVGESAGTNNTGSSCTIMGWSAGVNNQGDNNTIVGRFAGGGDTITGGENSLFGASAGKSLTSGQRNFFAGYQAGRDCLTGQQNVAIGRNSFRTGTGSHNMMLGTNVGLIATTATQNVGIGTESLFNITSGATNVCAGYRSGFTIAATDNNVCLGDQAGNLLDSDNNIAVGARCANNLTSGGTNLMMGYDIDAPSATASNQMSIGNLLFSEGIDGTSTTISTGHLGVARVSPRGKLDVDQFSTTAAIPVLVLDQADISEEMIEFVTTIGTGNPIEAVGAKVFTLTHFVKTTIPGGLTRYLQLGTIA